MSASTSDVSNDFTLLYNPGWGYNRCSTKAYFKPTPNPTSFQHGYYGIENSTIKGSFHLCYPVHSPLYSDKIELIFEGIQVISWKENNIVTTKENILYKQSKIIWKSTNNNYEELSILDLPFEFDLPDNLPATITSLNVKGHEGNNAGGVAGDGTEIGHITYSLRAEISRPINLFKLQISQKKIVEVWCRIQRWQKLEGINTFDRPFKWINSNDDIRYEVELEKTLFNYKDTINIPMKFFINDLNKVKIKKISVRIKESHELKIDDKSKKIGGFVIIDTAFGEQAKKSRTSNGDDYYFIKMKLNLTKANLGRKLNCSTINEMIDIRHKLRIKILLENSNSPSIELEKEITILNFITKQDISEHHHLMNTWFYHNESKTEETFVKPKMIKTFSWPIGRTKNGTIFQKNRLSLFGGRNSGYF
ncbi:hypothetical protein RclHR1_04110006 [Rhizophagus clarus]|uniref:Arrestin C-terminal-like domain-containing protein n=1 Tax=Rhizophagus clarus TaxID=94130 RepID=A0A2Z6RGR1_9GLOM|nr:hypothetical protein RclHR1_04110006 [Rhizophagus clarus]GES84406.1 hypothetical protein GLOIN_2v1707499 [Rhizophagus clarus]